MFESVPAQIWLLIVIGLAAYPAVQYAYRYVVHSPSRRDITQPIGDLEWRTPSRFALSAIFMLFLCGLAVFIFTPAAAEFAQSPSFFPLLLAGSAAYSGYVVVQGFLKGEVEPIIKGGLGRYQRINHPIRYWASMIWNILFASLCVFVAFKA
jgi:hypothetical protein